MMGIAIGVIAIELDWSGLSHAPLLRAIWLGIILLLAAIVYFSMLRIFGIRWVQFLKKDKA